MKSLVVILSLTLASLLGSAREGSLAGMWRGAIRTQGGGLGAVLHIEPEGAEGWTGTADTPSQGAFGIPLSDIECTPEGVFSMSITQTGARIEGHLSEDGQHLLGTWSQNGASLPLECERLPDPEPLPAELRNGAAGLWEGRLAAGPIELRLRLELVARADGALRGSFTSPDQSPQGIPVTRTDWLGEQRLRVCVGSIFLVLELGLAADGAHLEGSFLQGGSTLPITLTKVARPTALKRPQNPVPPFPYSSEEVSFPGGAPGVHLAGTLTLPPGDGPHVTALLISGSGAQDRDETIFEHKPFWVLADALARRGIAVLRVDDRGVGGSTTGSSPALDTTADLAQDARAAVAFLRSRSAVGAVGLVGHSEGGVIAPLVAADDTQIAFVVMLAGCGVPGGDLLCMQVEALNRASGTTGPELAAGLALQRKLMDIVADAELPTEVATERLRTALESDPSFAEIEGAQAAVDAALAQLQLPWTVWFVRHDPAPVLARVRCPVLALNGALDLQVPAGPNLAAIQAALEAGGNTDFEVHELAQLNHLFQHARTGLVAEYGRIEETLAPEVLERIAAWINQRYAD